MILSFPGRHDLAIVDCTKWIEQAPKSTSAYSRRIQSLMAAGRLQDALADCKRWQEIDPKSTAASAQLSDVLSEIKGGSKRRRRKGDKGKKKGKGKGKRKNK